VPSLGGRSHSQSQHKKASDFSLDKNERSYYFNIMTKGEDRKFEILEVGLDMASRLGLEAVTIGTLAKAIGMSKSGLFAHFQSKENLQIDILKHAEEDFSAKVLGPALTTPAGIPRIKALLKKWIEWGSKLTGGCIFVSAATEFSDRPGKVRDFLLHQQEQWIESLRRMAESAIKAGDFRHDIDCGQFAFDLYSLLLGFHYYHQLLRDPHTLKRQEEALERLLESYR
jgi:AcrR family transcriptional regulator